METYIKHYACTRTHGFYSQAIDSTLLIPLALPLFDVHLSKKVSSFTYFIYNNNPVAIKPIEVQGVPTDCLSHFHLTWAGHVA